MTASKYFQVEDLATVARNIKETANRISPPPVKKRRNRTPRGFGIYTYRGNKFLFNYVGEVATVHLLDSRTSKPVANVQVPKDRAYIAARALVRIMEAEAVLRELEKRD